VLDLLGDERTVGKSLGTDLEQQKATLPVIYLLRTATPADREQVLSILRGEEPSRADALAPWLQRYDACGYSYEVARRYARDAIQQLEGLRPSLARQTLEALSEFVVSRSL
jgi:octaprenyl-diphosphate synthase